MKAIADYFHKAIAMATDREMGRRGCFFINLLMAADIPTPELQQAIDREVMFFASILDLFYQGFDSLAKPLGTRIEINRASFSWR
jgi:hypothetical protein